MTQPRLPRNAPALAALRALLSTGRLLTAAEVALETGCSLPAAHRRIRQLRQSGCALQTRRVRQGKSGPASVAYAVVDRKRRKS